jgi:hypothetical protein
MSKIRYFIVSCSPTLQAVVSLSEEGEIRTLECTNYEVCYYSNILVNGRCPQYCEVIVEAKKFAFGRRKPKANVREIEEHQLGRFVALERLPIKH